MNETSSSRIRLGPGLEPVSYCKWLRVGMEQFFIEGKGALAFPGLGECYGRNPSIGDDIVEAAQALPAADREDFRSAVVEMVRETPFDIEPLYVEALLLIAVGLQAKGVLEIVAHKSFTLRDGESAVTILRYCFECARDLALSSGSSAERCLIHITSQAVFSSAFAGQALEALTAANPENFASHLSALRKQLDEIYGDGYQGREDKIALRDRRRLLVRSIQKFGIDLNDLLVDPRSHLEIQQTGSVYWWIDALANEVKWEQIRQILIAPRLPSAPEISYAPPPHGSDFEENTEFDTDEQMLESCLGSLSLEAPFKQYLVGGMS